MSITLAEGTKYSPQAGGAVEMLKVGDDDDGDDDNDDDDGISTYSVATSRTSRTARTARTVRTALSGGHVRARAHAHARARVPKPVHKPVAPVVKESDDPLENAPLLTEEAPILMSVYEHEHEPVPLQLQELTENDMILLQHATPRKDKEPVRDMDRSEVMTIELGDDTASVELQTSEDALSARLSRLRRAKK